MNPNEKITCILSLGIKYLKYTIKLTSKIAVTILIRKYIRNKIGLIKETYLPNNKVRNRIKDREGKLNK